MRIIRNMLNRRPIAETAGVTAIEYGLIAALIAVGIITAITLVGTNLASTFNAIAGYLHT